MSPTRIDFRVFAAVAEDSISEAHLGPQSFLRVTVAGDGEEAAAWLVDEQEHMWKAESRSS